LNFSQLIECHIGAIITSSGLVDVTLYTLTRRALLIDSEPSQDRSYNKFASSKGRDNHLTTITADPSNRKMGLSDNTIIEREGSTDNIVQPGVEMTPMGKVYQETTIEITTEPAYGGEASSERSSKDDFQKDEFSEAPSRTMWRR
jgi:hypothetical protein